MSLLVVMSHFDVHGRLRAHTRRTLAAYAEAAERVVLVTTSGIDDESRASLPPHVDVVTRRNFGYDFFSYKWGLEHVPEHADFEQVLITNDTFVGPTVPVRTILDSPQVREADLAGMTLSASHGTHVQSFFVVVSRRVARSRVFRSFWKDMTPVSDRQRVIASYEVGLSRTVAGAGFRLGGYLRPTPAEQELARRRFAHHKDVRLHGRTTWKVMSEVQPVAETDLRAYNPAVALADRVLLDDRLPLVKFDTLRFDPYALGADRLLDACERRLPDHFEGVRDYLAATRVRYPSRAGEINLAVAPRELRERGIGYGSGPGFGHAAAPHDVKETVR